MPLVINPASYGSTSSPNAEVVWVVGYTNGSTATVMRGQEGTTANTSNWATNTVFVNGPLTNDFGITNQITNGDFPIPIASGQVLTSTASGINAPVWNTPSGPLASGVTVSGYQIYGDLSTNATISGSQVTGNISATQISGALNNATISGVQIKGLTGGTNISVAPFANNLVITNTAVQPTGARSDGGGTTTKINSSIGYISGYGQLSISGYTNYLVIIDGTVTNINTSTNSTINIGVGVDSTTAFSKFVNMYALSNSAMSYSYSFSISGLSTVAHTFNPLAQQTAGPASSTYLQESHITVIGLS